MCSFGIPNAETAFGLDFKKENPMVEVGEDNSPRRRSDVNRRLPVFACSFPVGASKRLPGIAAVNGRGYSPRRTLAR
jgi:hypothetical protein